MAKFFLFAVISGRLERLGNVIGILGLALRWSGKKRMQTQSSTDEGLVRDVLTGDEIAFSQLYERYRQPIYSAAFRIIRNHEDAQDAAQEVAYKLYRSLHQWDVQKSKLSTWIYKMTVNHSIDCHRVRRRRMESQWPEDGTDQGAHFDIPDRSARSALSEIENKEQIHEVLQFAGTLPAQQRQIFIARYFNEHKLEEIAETQRCSLGTVKSSLHRATHTLRARGRSDASPLVP